MNMQTSYTTTKIVLKDSINSEILREGFKPGDVVAAEIDNSGAAWIDSRIDHLENGRQCVVYPADYRLPEAPKAPGSSAPAMSEVIEKVRESIKSRSNSAQVNRILDAMATKNPALFREFVDVMGGSFTELVHLAERDAPQDLAHFLDQDADVKLNKLGVTQDEVKTWLKSKGDADRLLAIEILKEAQAGAWLWRESGEVAVFDNALCNRDFFGIEGTIPEILKRVNLPQYAKAVPRILAFFNRDCYKKEGGAE